MWRGLENVYIFNTLRLCWINLHCAWTWTWILLYLSCLHLKLIALMVAKMQSSSSLSIYFYMFPIIGKVLQNLKLFSNLLFVRYGHLIALGHWVNESLHSRYIVCCPSLFRYRLVQMFWLTNAWRKNFNSNLLRRIVFSGATLNWFCWLLLWWWSIVFDSFWDHALWLWSFLFLPIIWLRLHHVLGFDW